MRNQWRLLLLRSVSRSSLQTPATSLLQLQKVDRNFSYLSSFLGSNVHGNAITSDFTNPRSRSFSSESDLEPNNELDHVAFTDILSKSSTNDEIKTGLDSLNLSISHQMVLNTLWILQGNPEIAWKFFSFVSETENARLSSKSYNLMLAILGRKDYVEQFWGLLEVMQKKGYGISKITYIRALESFEKEGMVSDLVKLKELYAAKPDENSIERVCYRVCKVIRENEWDEVVQQKLSDLNCSWSSDLVAMAIEHLKVNPMKALMFFWWVEANLSFKHDKLSYTAMLNVLTREDSVDKFWRILDEMKEAGYQMEMETYVFVIQRFYKRRMIKDAVDLYEYMMSGATKPSVRDSVFLLQKIAVSKELDMELFSRALRIFTHGGNNLTESTFCSVVKSLISVGRLQECGCILKAMVKCGFVPTNEIYDRTIFKLGRLGKSVEAIQIIDEMEASGNHPDFKTWSSLINGQCEARNVVKASSSFRSMVEKFGVEDAGYIFDLLMNGFCQKKKAEDAYKFLSEMVDGTELRPWHKTYKMLIEKLLVRRNFNEALSLLRLMKANDYPPYLDPFFGYISKSGSGIDAMSFLNAVTDKRFPSTSVFIRMFEAFFKAGRHSEAQNFMSECPSYIRSDADVLNLFCAQKPEVADTSAVAA